MREFGAKGCMKAQQDSRNVLNRSRTIYSSKCLEGFERWSAEATFCTPAQRYHENVASARRVQRVGKHNQSEGEENLNITL